MSEDILTVEHLKVGFRTERGVVHAVDDVSWTLRRGEVLSVVGESGSGKSVSAMTLMGLTRSNNAEISGTATLADGTELVGLPEDQMRRIRGGRISMIFQDPMSALTPVYRIGDQIVEQIRAHEKVSKQAANARAIDLLKRVGIPRAEERARAYPHQFSGGMRQRVMIAMALSCSPEILIADEPTTALDVTIQAQILGEIEDLRTETGVGVLLITHDLGVVAEVADRVVVMYAGRVVEEADLRELFKDPMHPYTWGLLGSIPRIDQARPARLPTISGSPPSLLNPPAGCHFITRCPHRIDACHTEPELKSSAIGSLHRDRCLLPADEKRSLRVVNGSIGLPAAAVEAVPAGVDGPEAPTTQGSLDSALGLDSPEGRLS
ncbi:ABC transporter ATP-binding protein [Jatrophihabitans sp.]|uniref:ABC transporter ATP-binding protein n=1 Tax=Jatrophihabitans sp. TaxID=1932789 RepID=UPI0030C70B53|nr:oligopeptide/dipeptide transporter, ATPase subunit [Jatrophihabitans sp.]